MGYRSTLRRAVVPVTATAVALGTAAACGEEPVNPGVRQAIGDACRQVRLLQKDGAGSPDAAAEAVLWGQTQSAMASSVDSRAEQLAGHLAEMRRIMVAPTGRRANPSPDLAAFAAANESAARECRELEDQF